MSYSMKIIIQKLIALFRELGFLVGVLYLFDKGLKQVSPNLRLLSHALMVQPISNKPLLPPSMKKIFEYREIKPGDKHLNNMPRPMTIIEYRFNQKAICLGLFKKEELIGYIWFCFNSYKEDEARCIYLLEPKNESVFDYDLYIFPEHRLGLAFIALWDEANRFLHERGIKQTYSRLTQSNIASHKAHEHFGWKRVAQAFYFKAWRFELMLTTTSPYLGFSFRESGRIKIKLTPEALI